MSEMNPQFIRTFADDLSELRKRYRIGSQVEVIISDALIKLHRIARILESEDINVRKDSKDSGI